MAVPVGLVVSSPSVGDRNPPPLPDVFGDVQDVAGCFAPDGRAFHAVRTPPVSGRSDPGELRALDPAFADALVGDGPGCPGHLERRQLQIKVLFWTGGLWRRARWLAS